MNLSDVLLECARHFERKPICVFEGREIAYSPFVDRVRRLSTALQDMGAGPGKIVVLLADNRPEWLASFFAILGSGACAVPINPALAASEVQTITAHCEPHVMIVQNELIGLIEGGWAAPHVCTLGGEESTWHRLSEKCEPISEFVGVRPDDPALIFYTSGTTGKPKGVVLSHGSQRFIATMFSEHLRITPDDVSLVTGSLAFIYHIVLNSLTTMHGGASFVLLGRFHPEHACRAIERYRVTIMMAVPTAYVMMSNWRAVNDCDLGSMRFAITGGSNFPTALGDRLREGLGFPVFDLWGLTECTPATAHDPARDRSGQPDSCGRALPGFSIRVVDDDLRDLPVGEVGEVLLRSPSMMTCYYKNPEATAETIVDGWVRSGDLGKVDSEGFVYIIGRKKDLIVRGGANIYPVDVEDVLYRHEAVGECAVVGVQDPTYGEAVKAFIVLKPGKETTASDIIQFCRTYIAEYKTPAIVEFTSALPKGPTGKILKRSLR